MKKTTHPLPPDVQLAGIASANQAAGLTARSPSMRQRPPGLAAAAAIVCVAALGIAEASTAGTRRDDREDGRYRSLAKRFQSTGVVTADGQRCSGTLIAPRWVITAAHCVDEGATRAFFVPLGVSLPTVGWVPHPFWNGNIAAGNDLALLELVDPARGLAPVPLSPLETDELIGRTGTYVGYGHSGTGLTGESPPAGTKRAGTNTIDTRGASKDGRNLHRMGAEDVEVDEFDVTGFSNRLLFADFDRPGDPSESTLGSSEPLDLELAIAPGDSGGGIYIDGALAGVHCFLLATDGDSNADYGDLMASTAIAPHRGWIVRTIPEPSPALLGVVAIGTAARLARRSAHG